MIEIDPSAVVQAMDRNVRGFEMPGTGIPDYGAHAKAIANAGIYDFAAHHDHILKPIVLDHWKVESIEGLDAGAEQARESLVRYIERVGKAGRRMADRRNDRQTRAAERGEELTGASA